MIRLENFTGTLVTQTDIAKLFAVSAPAVTHWVNEKHANHSFPKHTFLANSAKLYLLTDIIGWLEMREGNHHSESNRRNATRALKYFRQNRGDLN